MVFASRVIFYVLPWMVSIAGHRSGCRGVRSVDEGVGADDAGRAQRPLRGTAPSPPLATRSSFAIPTCPRGRECQWAGCPPQGPQRRFTFVPVICRPDALISKRRAGPSVEQQRDG